VSSDVLSLPLFHGLPLLSFLHHGLQQRFLRFFPLTVTAASFSGPVWLAGPSPYGSSIHSTLAVLAGALGRCF